MKSSGGAPRILTSIPYLMSRRRREDPVHLFDHLRILQAEFEFHPPGSVRVLASVLVINQIGIAAPLGGHNLLQLVFLHPAQGIQIQAAVMGAEKGSPFVKEVLDWYEGKHFVKEDGTLRTDILSPYIYARVAETKGFVYKDIDQQLPDRIHIYPSEIFAGNKHEVTKESYAIHLCAHSWHLTPWEKIRRFLGISKKHKQSHEL